LKITVIRRLLVIQITVWIHGTDMSMARWPWQNSGELGSFVTELVEASSSASVLKSWVC
jgi:hypothetical protein